MRQKPARISLDPLNNVLFDILPEEIVCEDLASQYAMHQRTANPDIGPEKTPRLSAGAFILRDGNGIFRCFSQLDVLQY